MPLARFLPTAARFVSTRDWIMARDELKFVRIFDRALELRNSNGWLGTLHAVAPRRPPVPRGHWDDLLEEMWWMARDFDQEAAWKRSMARRLAREARQRCVLMRKGLVAAATSSAAAVYPVERRLLMELAQGQLKIYGPGVPLTAPAGWKADGVTEGFALPAFAPMEEETWPGCLQEEEEATSRRHPHAQEAGGESLSDAAVPHREWTLFEDCQLRLLIRSIGGGRPRALAAGSLCGMLNQIVYGGRTVRSPGEVKHRLLQLASQEEGGGSGGRDTASPSSPRSASGGGGLSAIEEATGRAIPPHRARLHVNRVNLMNSINTKLITVRSTPAMPKKLNTAAHPSHEAAARKANQNISKLLTPQELAMRRIQRTRIVTDPSGAIVVG